MSCFHQQKNSQPRFITYTTVTGQTCAVTANSSKLNGYTCPQYISDLIRLFRINMYIRHVHVHVMYERTCTCTVCSSSTLHAAEF